MIGGFVCHADGTVEDYDDWAATEFGPQISAQAWSEGDHAHGVKPYGRHTWGWVHSLAAAILAVGVLVSGGLLAVGLSSGTEGDDHNAWPAGYNSPPTAKTADPPPDPPLRRPAPFVPDAQPITADGVFLQGVLAAKWRYDDNQAAINAAHNWCRVMALGYTPYQIAVELQIKDAGLPGYPTMAEQILIIDAAAKAYCPQYGGVR